MTPSWRKPVGVLVLLGYMAAWTMLAVSVAAILPDWGELVRLMYYLIAGTIWIVPLKPWLQWMETGRFAAPGMSDKVDDNQPTSS